jgi:dCTP deaminase
MADEQPAAQPANAAAAPRPPQIPAGFWSGETLRALQQGSVPLIDPQHFDERRIDCNSYTLSMGDQYFVTSTKGDFEPPTIVNLEAGGQTVFNIPAGQFAFLITKEMVSIPHYAMAFISMRTGFKFQGLVNVSGFHVDPGFRGRLIFAVYNASPISIPIKQGELLFKIWFASLDRISAEPFVYTKEPLLEISKDLIRGMSRELLSLQQLNDKIRDVETSLNLKIEGFSLKVGLLYIIWQGAILAVVLAVVLAVIKLAFPGLWSIIDPTIKPPAQVSTQTAPRQPPAPPAPAAPPPVVQQPTLTPAPAAPAPPQQ